MSPRFAAKSCRLKIFCIGMVFWDMEGARQRRLYDKSTLCFEMLIFLQQSLLIGSYSGGASLPGKFRMLDGWEIR